jgi:response regulator RpfG family c-di-GMP phosphodiesterase
MADVVAIFNSSEETVDLVKDVLERAGFLVFLGHVMDIRRGNIDLEAFVRQHRPKVIVYDLVPPYEVTWAFLEHLRHNDAMKGVQFVLTSMNAQRVEEIVKPNEHVYEIVGKPADLGEIVRAVKEASRARPTR